MLPTDALTNQLLRYTAAELLAEQTPYDGPFELQFKAPHITVLETTEIPQTTNG